MSLKRLLYAVAALVFFAELQTYSAPKLPPSLKNAPPPPPKVSSDPLKEGDLVFISLCERFSLLDAPDGHWPEVVSTGGQIIPAQFAGHIARPRARIRFEKNYAPPAGSIKKVNPAADPTPKMYVVQSTANGILVLTPALGSWNDHGPPTREITFINPNKQKLSSKDLQRILKGSGSVDNGNKHVQKMLATWRQIMQGPPQEFPEHCPDEAPPEPEPTPNPTEPPAQVVKKAPKAPRPIDDDFGTGTVTWHNDWVPPVARAVLTKAQFAAIEDQMKPLAERQSKIYDDWETTDMATTARIYGDLAKESGQFLATSELAELEEWRKLENTLKGRKDDHARERNDFLDRLCEQYPDHCVEIWDRFFKLSCHPPNCFMGSDDD